MASFKPPCLDLHVRVVNTVETGRDSNGAEVSQVRQAQNHLQKLLVHDAADLKPDTRSRTRTTNSRRFRDTPPNRSACSPGRRSLRDADSSGFCEDTSSRSSSSSLFDLRSLPLRASLSSGSSSCSCTVVSFSCRDLLYLSPVLDLDSHESPKRDVTALTPSSRRPHGRRSSCMVDSSS